MRIVALDALLLLEGLMSIRELLAGLRNVRMTLETQFSASGVQQLIVTSRVRSVTG